jgi:hypothetical protein
MRACSVFRETALQLTPPRTSEGDGQSRLAYGFGVASRRNQEDERNRFFANWRSVSNLVREPTCEYIAGNMKRTAALSIVLGIALAVMLWLSWDASDEIFQSRLLPWIPSLIYAQDAGLMVAARLFPCQKEGFDTGCEAFKTIPTFVASNALVYSAIFLPIVHLCRKKRSRGRRTGE